MRVRERIQTTRQADKSEIGRRRRNKSGWMRRVQPDQDGVLATLGQFSQGYVGRRNESTSRTPPPYLKERKRFVSLIITIKKILPYRNFIMSRDRIVSSSDENFWERSIWRFLSYFSVVFFFYCFKLEMITLLALDENTTNRICSFLVHIMWEIYVLLRYY